jgi:tetratricopeptide (TPR) repeat protein
LLALAAVAVLALFLSDAYINRARSVIARPPAELAAARAAARLDPWSVTPHYLEASAYETMGNRPAAYRQLRAALSLEPENSAAWGVLGDFAARGGDARAARAYYRRALVLNPLDSGLQQLARYGEPGAPGGAAGSRAPR